MCSSGIAEMYFYNGVQRQLEALGQSSSDDDWFLDSIMVLGGDYTRPDLKDELVDTILGLYAMVVNGLVHPEYLNQSTLKLNGLIEEHFGEVHLDKLQKEKSNTTLNEVHLDKMASQHRRYRSPFEVHQSPPL